MIAAFIVCCLLAVGRSNSRCAFLQAAGPQLLVVAVVAVVAVALALHHEASAAANPVSLVASVWPSSGFSPVAAGRVYPFFAFSFAGICYTAQKQLVLLLSLPPYPLLHISCSFRSFLLRFYFFSSTSPSTSLSCQPLTTLYSISLASERDRTEKRRFLRRAAFSLPAR